jgi:maltose/maltodextrin transport system substrate-binding protein
LALFLVPTKSFGWKDGELLIWMDSARAQGLEPIAKKFEKDLGVKVTIVKPQNITNDFPLTAQVGEGPDIVIWAHDKVGEWADGGLIAPVVVSKEFESKFFAKGWEAVRHNQEVWGYPLSMETVTLIYNKRLLDGPPPTELSQLLSTNRIMEKRHPGVTTILWDYDVRELNAAIDLGQVMPNIPEMGVFFSSVGDALQIATQGRASAQRALSDAAADMRNE